MSASVEKVLAAGFVLPEDVVGNVQDEIAGQNQEDNVRDALAWVANLGHADEGRVG